MTEQDARDWLCLSFGQVAYGRLTRFAERVMAANKDQNLIAPSTVATIWTRHLVDSAQLILVAERHQANIVSWLDIGSGAGFPGMVVALLRDCQVVLVEPRRKRAEFLLSSVADFGLGDRVNVVQKAIGVVDGSANVISARAVANLSALFGMSEHCARADTLWVLPKGRSANEELAQARALWHGVFHVEQSITDADARIVVAEKVSRRCK